MLLEPRCFTRGCRHLTGVRDLIAGDETTQVVVCQAFPRGIPERIAYGTDTHEAVWPTQVGSLVYAPKEK